MKPAPFDYLAPETIEDALQSLSDGDAMILAGGQTLMPLLALRLSTPARNRSRKPSTNISEQP